MHRPSTSGTVPSSWPDRRLQKYAHPSSGAGDFAWSKWLLVLVLIVSCYLGYQKAHKRGSSGDGIGSIASRAGRVNSADQLATLAADTQASDVFMFSADWCPNCREAKSWMGQHGFKYEQCDIDRDHGCQARLASLGGDGIPYLIVRGHHMRDGFDSREFAAALRSTRVGSEKQQGAGQ